MLRPKIVRIKQLTVAVVAGENFWRDLSSGFYNPLPKQSFNHLRADVTISLLVTG